MIIFATLGKNFIQPVSACLRMSLSHFFRNIVENNEKTVSSQSAYEA
jgi:hypothetical protein